MNLSEAYLRAVYPPGASQRLRQRLQDHRGEVRHWGQEVGRLESLLGDLEQALEAVEASELAEFLQGERELRYNDLRQARAKLATAEGKVLETEKILRRAEWAQRFVTWRSKN